MRAMLLSLPCAHEAYVQVHIPHSKPRKLRAPEALSQVQCAARENECQANHKDARACSIAKCVIYWRQAQECCWQEQHLAQALEII